MSYEIVSLPRRTRCMAAILSATPAVGRLKCSAFWASQSWIFQG
ncbi:hypothetical protein [Rhizobium leguminosarum]|nr:hypothetical protein [Rhizobium leguminosarum]